MNELLIIIAILIFIFSLFVFIAGLFIGWLTFPLILFLRARKDPSWDDSNMTNIYRVIAHLGTHPNEFGEMRYSSGKRPFWYISKDELSDVVKTRNN